MGWPELQAGLPTLMTDLLGISCQWATQPRRMVQGSSAVIDIIAFDSLGVDDRAWSDVVEDAEVVAVQATQFGIREATLQITVWSPSQVLGDSGRARLDSLRTRLRLPSVLARLSALGLALVRIEGVVQIDTTQDMRAYSQASMDVRVALGSTATDEPTDYIETARIEGDSIPIDLNPPESEP